MLILKYADLAIFTTYSGRRKCIFSPKKAPAASLTRNIEHFAQKDAPAASLTRIFFRRGKHLRQASHVNNVHRLMSGADAAPWILILKHNTYF